MMKSIYEQMGGTYTLGEDGMYYPDLALPEEDVPCYGRYGRMRKAYLREYHPSVYFNLLASGQLAAHLNQVDEIVHEKLAVLIDQMAEAQHITEDLKARDMLAWVGAMNNIRSAAEELVRKDLFDV